MHAKCIGLLQYMLQYMSHIVTVPHLSMQCSGCTSVWELLTSLAVLQDYLGVVSVCWAQIMLDQLGDISKHTVGCVIV